MLFGHPVDQVFVVSRHILPLLFDRPCEVRLHGSPRIYYSAYDAHFLQRLDERLTAMLASSDVWCIFDNAAQGAAMDNVLTLRDRAWSKREAVSDDVGTVLLPEAS
jgi:uncharacterized protein YecE (DUF72 family)